MRIAVTFFIFSAVAAAADSRPNVLFIAADDLGNVIGNPDYPQARTPHLDRLARTGVHFTRAYNQIPLCNPSRASLLTGLRPDTLGVYDLARHFRETVPDVVTLPQAFRRAGWWAGRVGKIFHYGVPGDIGTNGHDDPPSWDAVVNPKGRDVADQKLITNPTPTRPISAALSWLAAEGDDAVQTDGMIATEAIRMLGEKRDRPFFLGVGFFRPHTPFVAPKKYFDLHPLEKIQLPATPPGDRDDIPAAAFAHNNPTPHYGLDEATCRRALQAYYASVSFLDAQVGRLLDALDAHGLAGNTIVVFWSDHGYHLGEHGGVWQKRTLFEESARAPLIIRTPGAAGNGRACTQVVEFLDIFPTLAELAGITPPSNLSGRSLAPLLANPRRAWIGQAFTQILRPGDGTPVMGRSVRTERWRYTEWNGGAAGAELYDQQADPHEFNNLANDPARRLTREQLRKRFEGRARADAPAGGFDPAKL